MGALNGYKILDFSTLLPGPYATMTLADMGADVLKVSSKDRYDLVVNWGKKIDGTDVTPCQAWLGRNKKTIFLDLKNEKSIEAIKKLVLEYDIVVEQFRPGVMNKFGLDYDSLKKINNKIIYCSITGYGQTGTYAKKAGHDINYLARSGIAYSSGKKMTGPSLYNFQIADIAGGSMNAVCSILAAIIYRDKTGIGQYIDVSMQDSIIPYNTMDGAEFFSSARVPEREALMLNGGGIYDFYETKDNQYMSVGSLEPKFFEKLCIVVGHPEWSDGKVLKNDVSIIKKELIKIFKTKTRDEWTKIFSEEDACVEPVLDLNECSKDEHLNSRDMFPELVVPESNGVKIKELGSPIRLSESPVEYKFAGYKEGFHTYEVLEKLGYSKDDILEMSGGYDGK